MSASMNSTNAVAGDLNVASVTNGEPNNNIRTNSTANDMSLTSPPISVHSEMVAGGNVATSKCDEQSKQLTVKINCHSNTNNDNNSVAAVSNRSASGAGTNISKSWYARCNNRWRSQSCDRKHKNMVIRYSWNTAAINRLA